MDKQWLLKRLQEMGAEFIRPTVGGYTVYRNLPLGIGFIHIMRMENGTFEFLDWHWEVMSNTRLPNDTEILTNFSLDTVEDLI